VRIEPRLFWKAGAIRFTLDGSEPKADSSTYSGPFFLEKTATVRAAVLDDAKRVGPIASTKIDVNDVTPPKVVRATPMYRSPEVQIAFSEPVDTSACEAARYTLDPAIEVRSVRKGSGPCEVILELAAPPEVERKYKLRIAGVQDASPAHNTMKPAALELRIPGPVFRLEAVAAEQMGKEVRDVAGLPIHAKDAWTLNCFVRTEREPDDRTVIVGFGRCDDEVEGTGRYLTKFPGGAHFWSRNRDVPGRTPLDLGRWQMLTATYDGKVLRLYKDARKIGERELGLSDDENAIRFAPADPWEKKRRFEGEIRELTIWSAALDDEAILSLSRSSEPR
jgi:alpha-mannosidase